MTDHTITGTARPIASVTLNEADLPKLVPFTFQVLVYGNELGNMIQHRVISTGAAPPEFHAFLGACQRKVQFGQGAQAQVGTIPLEFPIPGAKTLAEAWEFYDGCAQAALDVAVENIRAQHQQRQVGRVPTILTPEMIRQAGRTVPRG